jgi:hypothetical protein
MLVFYQLDVSITYDAVGFYGTISERLIITVELFTSYSL